MTLTDEDILARLVAVEDGTVERKPYTDSRGWVKTVVAFSNTLEADQPGILFVGVNDNGTIQDDASQNFEKLQKKISGELSNIYPPVYPTLLVREKDGQKFVAVIVYGSPSRPHFAGKSYVRDGTQTKDASEANIEGFIAKRSSKVAEILKWKDQQITVQKLSAQDPRSWARGSETERQVLHDCNQHWVTLRALGNSPALSTVSLKQVELNYDISNRCLLLIVYPL
jgi:predicted HTH transcriptional regulator